MGNEYYGAPTTPTTDYLAHYGVKGMKWGVRKAAEKGAISGAAGFANKRLGREYKKAQKKLAKLEKRATGGSKYVKRAAALGAGAAAAGGLAAIGTEGVAKGVGYAGKAFSQGAKGIGGAMQRIGGAMQSRGIKGGGRMTAAGKAVSDLSKHNASGYAQGIKEWGRGDSIVKSAGQKLGSISRPGVVNSTLVKTTGTNLAEYGEKLKRSGISNNTIARIGAGAIGAGLGIGAGYNAYRAATTKRAARKAAEFRKEMNKAFAGTSYANVPRTPQKKRRRG